MIEIPVEISASIIMPSNIRTNPRINRMAAEKTSGKTKSILFMI
jgi:hypothetical protein